MEKEKEQQQMTVFVDKPFYQEIKRVAQYKGLSLSSFVRLTLRERIDQQEKKHERQAA